MANSFGTWRSLVLAVLAIAALSTTFAHAQPRGISRERPTVTESDVANSSPELEVNVSGFSNAVRGLAFSPDDRLLAAAGIGAVRVWNLETGELVATLRGYYERKAYYGAVFDVDFSPDGKWLAVAAGDPTGEGAVRIYRVGQWSRVAEVLDRVRGYTDYVDFSADGETLAVSGYNNNTGSREFTTFDWPNRQLVGRYVKEVVDREGAARNSKFNDWLPYFGFAGRSRDLVEYGYDLNVFLPPRWQPAPTWDDVATDLTDLSTRAMEEKWPEYPADDVDGFAFDLRLDLQRCLWTGNGTRNGRSLYWGAIYSTESPEPLRVYVGHRYWPQSAALSSDGTLAATADVFGEVHVWETATARRRRVFRSDAPTVFRVAFSHDGTQLAFGTQPYGPDKWAANRYADLQHAFDLSKRVLRDEAAGQFIDSTDKRDDYRLTVKKRADEEAYDTKLMRGGQLVRSVKTTGQPYAWTFLRGDRTGLRLPVAIATYDGEVSVYEASPDGETEFQKRRIFWSGNGVPTSLSESADGRLLAVGNTDGVIRIYSLERFERRGTLDVDVEFDEHLHITRVGKSMQKFGFEIGDTLRTVDGEDYADFIDRAGRDPELFSNFAEGQHVAVVVERDGVEQTLDVVLPRGPDTAEPLLNLYVASDGEWVLWTPPGYFDASPGGAKLIGWRVNGKLDETARYFPATQFRKALYRPDVIDGILRLGNVEEAIAAVNAELPRGTVAVDLREREQFDKVRPPEVRIVSPTAGTSFDESRVKVVAEVRSPGSEEIREVKFLVNGRPSAAKGIARERDDGATTTSDGEVIATYEQDVSLAAGENTLSVIASTSQTSGASPALRVQYNPPVAEAATMPQLYVLALGCSKYADASLNLKFAEKDARAFAAAWLAQKGKFYRDVHVRLLVDEEATSDKLRDGMDWLVRSVTQHDVAMLFVSGHGVRDNRNNYYLATHDIDSRRLRATAVPHSDMLRLIEDMPCKVLLFVDTCHGGGITGAKSANVDDPWRDLVSEEVGAIIFASSHPRELSLEDDRWEHGAFTKAIVDVLADAKSDASGDGYLSVIELDLQVSERVKELTDGQQHPVTEKPATIRNFNLAKMPAP